MLRRNGIILYSTSAVPEFDFQNMGTFNMNGGSVYIHQYLVFSVPLLNLSKISSSLSSHSYEIVASSLVPWG